MEVKGVDLNGMCDEATLIGDVLLTEVFSRLPFEERLTTMPLVCKAWRNASLEPACWRSVDMNSWFKKRAESDFMWEFEYGCEEEMEFYIKKVVDRSCGQLRELRTMHCTDAAIEYIAERCPSLTVLSMPDSIYATDRAVTNLAANCPKLQELNVSDCYAVGKESLEAFGRHCKSLVSLSRNMVRKNDFLSVGPVGDGDDDARIVGQLLTNLKHLEMKKSTMSDVGLAHIAQGCGELEKLDLACCTLSPYALEQLVNFCPKLKHFVKPMIPRMHVNPKFLLIPFD